MRLQRLISTLSRSEKRYFRLSVQRTMGEQTPLYLKLFDHLLEPGSGKDAEARTALGLRRTQLANCKRRLYQELLTSLRNYHSGREVDLDLREKLDFAHLLYGKGLYLDALRLLVAAKEVAVKNHRDLLHLEIIEFEKLIESRHITLSRQEENRINQLIEESARRSSSVLNTSELFNMNLEIHGHYIENGHSRNAAEHTATQGFYRDIQARQIDRDFVPVTFQQKINRAQSHMWYHYIQLDFQAALEAAAQAASNFDLDRVETVMDPDLYMKTLYYVHVFSYLTGGKRDMERYSRRLGKFLDDHRKRLNANSNNLGQTYHYLMQLNVPLAERDYATAYALSREIKRHLSDADLLPTESRRCLLRYKFAAACYGYGRVDEAVDHLNRILNRNNAVMRQELIINVRLLESICHYELGNNTYVEYALARLSKYLRNSRDANQLHLLIVAALRQLITALPEERAVILRGLETRITPLLDDPLIQKSLVYLNVREWINLLRARSEIG